jgi:hypothetical protein
MLTREDIIDNWQDWQDQRLAWALEAHLIRPRDYDKHSPPAWLQTMLDENSACEQPHPMGLGYHEKTGYFVLFSSGQGPGICGIEKQGQDRSDDTTVV